MRRFAASPPRQDQGCGATQVRNGLCRCGDTALDTAQLQAAHAVRTFCTHSASCSEPSHELISLLTYAGLIVPSQVPSERQLPAGVDRRATNMATSSPVQRRSILHSFLYSWSRQSAHTYFGTIGRAVSEPGPVQGLARVAAHTSSGLRSCSGCSGGVLDTLYSRYTHVHLDHVR